MSEAVLKNGGEVLMGEAVSEKAQPQAGDVRAAMPTPPDTPLGDERDSLIVYIRNEASQPSQQYSQLIYEAQIGPDWSTVVSLSICNDEIIRKTHPQYYASTANTVLLG
ncbi:hypothetical protein Q1695_006839 [Nippostrongylus brasiliensis]|nr:hypothetical protein Q1695_006839 [Nippostrongylus brasiliensis]